MSDILVLCYHAVSPTWPAALSIHPDRFERQLSRLVRRGYRGATFFDALYRPRQGRTVVVTFDDAFRSVLEVAAPILERLELPGTVFVPTDWPDRAQPMAWPGIDGWSHTEHGDELLPLSWDQLRTLADRGWEVGSHTRSHPRLTTLDDRDLADELVVSREVCEERMGRPCHSIAYPYGDEDARVRAATAVAGYAAGAALSRSLQSGDKYAWPRVGIYVDDGERKFALKASRTVRRLRARLRADKRV